MRCIWTYKTYITGKREDMKSHSLKILYQLQIKQTFKILRLDYQIKMNDIPNRGTLPTAELSTNKSHQLSPCCLQCFRIDFIKYGIYNAFRSIAQPWDFNQMDIPICVTCLETRSNS